MKDSRNYNRVSFDSFVQFNFTDYEYTCELLDISLKGALIAACSGATPAPGTPCTLIINLDQAEEVQVIMQGRVAHKRENRVGIHCESIDIDSMSNLRKLIEYNLHDPALINRDLEELWHIY
ncbi:MAG: PilZ domain-containing protein [Gammaproteobacteria bacterium]|nr:PilZ domain-containing protein [Gammaproteobacteria bacterium]